MILYLTKTAHIQEIQQLQKKLSVMGFDSQLRTEDNQKLLAIIGGMDNHVRTELFESLPLVTHVSEFKNKLKLVGNDLRKSKTVIDIKGQQIGNGEFMVMAGPCSIESKEQIFAIAKQVSQSGATILRGGAFKPRTFTL